MSLVNIGPETEAIEYKKSTGEMKEAILSIVAILNKHQKGTLYFSVKNDGTVIGQVINEESLRKVSQAIRNHIMPSIYPEIKTVTFGDRDCIQVSFEGNRCPYLAYNVPRIRVADEDLVMEQAIYEEMMRKRDSISYSWERQISKYKVTDIDQNVFKSYLTRARKAGRISFDNDNPQEVLTKLELTDGEWLLNAGAALFMDLGINELQMAKFASDERLTFTDIRRFTGSIFDLADKAVQYIVDAMDWRVEFDGSLERKEIPEIPVDAIREAVINAFGHRMIESGQSVEVEVYRSFIEIYSPGKFPEGLTPEMFIREIRKPIRRNPLITRTLYYSKDMESFATGLKRIQQACDAIDCKVEYYSDEYGFTVRFYRHCGEGWTVQFIKDVSSAPIISEERAVKNVIKGTHDIKVKEKVGEKVGDKLRENQRRILEELKKNPYLSAKQLSEMIGISQRKIESNIRKLKDNKKLERIGSP